MRNVLKVRKGSFTTSLSNVLFVIGKQTLILHQKSIKSLIKRKSRMKDLNVHSVVGFREIGCGHSRMMHF